MSRMVNQVAVTQLNSDTEVMRAVKKWSHPRSCFRMTSDLHPAALGTLDLSMQSFQPCRQVYTCALCELSRQKGVCRFLESHFLHLMSESYSSLFSTKLSRMKITWAAGEGASCHMCLQLCWKLRTLGKRIAQHSVPFRKLYLVADFWNISGFSDRWKD